MFGANGRIDLTQGLRRPVDRDYYTMTSPPVIVRDIIVVGSSVFDGGKSGRHRPVTFVASMSDHGCPWIQTFPKEATVMLDWDGRREYLR